MGSLIYMGSVILSVLLFVLGCYLYFTKPYWFFNLLKKLSPKESKLPNKIVESKFFIVISRISYVTIIVLLPAIIASPVFYEYTGFSNRLMVWQDGKLVDCSFGTFSNNYINVPTSTITSFISITPITENPKVRKIKYHVNTKISNPQIFYTQKNRKKYIDGFELSNSSDPLRKDIKETTQYWLYEFNDSHSRELSKFYNPFDPQQQAKFKSLVEQWINEKLLSEGLIIQTGNFSLPED